MPKWFAAKTVYRAQLEGVAGEADADALAELPISFQATALDENEARLAALIEERVVLFWAETADEAIERAEQEAGTYASGEAINVLGQRIVNRVLSYVETYELDSVPNDGVELFSRTFLSKKSLEDKDVLDHVAPLDDLPSELRRLFEPNLSQTARRIGVRQAADSDE